MTIPAVYKFVNWITGTPVPIDDAIASAITPPVDNALNQAFIDYINELIISGELPNLKALDADLILYVSPTGNDSNDGLTPATAFLTPQRGVDTAAEYIAFNFNITVQLLDGNYPLTSTLTFKNILGAGTYTLLGNAATPANVTFSCIS